MAMITPEYCLMMARYNAWQNRQLRGSLEALSADDLRRDRGAFFGSILATLNHILWADMLWIARFDGGDPPPVPVEDHTTWQPTLAAWGAERFRTDGRIMLWAEQVKAIDLAGTLTWTSGILGRDVTQPKAQCLTHMFNHQTHHRGQVHAMMTQAGLTTGVTDLVFMPEDGPWL